MNTCQIHPESQYETGYLCSKCALEANFGMTPGTYDDEVANFKKFKQLLDEQMEKLGYFDKL